MVSHWAHESASLYFSISEKNWAKRREELYILLLCCLVVGTGKRICLMLGAGAVQAVSCFTTITMASWPTHLFFVLRIPYIKRGGWGVRGGINLWWFGGENGCQVPRKVQNQHLVTKGKAPCRNSVKYLTPSQFPDGFWRQPDTCFARKLLVRFNFQSSFFQLNFNFCSQFRVIAVTGKS